MSSILVWGLCSSTMQTTISLQATKQWLIHKHSISANEDYPSNSIEALQQAFLYKHQMSRILAYQSLNTLEALQP